MLAQAAAREQKRQQLSQELRRAHAEGALGAPGDLSARLNVSRAPEHDGIEMPIRVLPFAGADAFSDAGMCARALPRMTLPPAPPDFARTPAREAAHKLLAAAIALSLTFGAFSLVYPAPARAALQSMRGDLQLLAGISERALAVASRDVATLSGATLAMSGSRPLETHAHHHAAPTARIRSSAAAANAAAVFSSLLGVIATTAADIARGFDIAVSAAAHAATSLFDFAVAVARNAPAKSATITADTASHAGVRATPPRARSTQSASAASSVSATGATSTTQQLSYLSSAQQQTQYAQRSSVTAPSGQLQKDSSARDSASAPKEQPATQSFSIGTPSAALPAPVAAYVTPSALNDQLAGLENWVRGYVALATTTPTGAQIPSYIAAGGNSQYTAPVSVSAFAPSQAINNLSNVTVSHVSGLTASDIPTLAYLQLTGGTLSGLGTWANGFVSQASSTIAGNLTVTGALNGATLSLSNASTTLFSAYGPAYFGATATSTFGADGSLTLAGALAANGNTTLTNATTTFLFVKSTVTASSASFGGTATSTFGTNGSLNLASALTAPSATVGALTATSTFAVSNTASFFGTSSFGATATSSFNSAGALTLASALGAASGGTGWTNINSGSILFGNGSSALATSSNLFWDSTNSRLGIGTTTPGTLLSLNNIANFTTGTSTLYNGLSLSTLNVNGTATFASTTLQNATTTSLAISNLTAGRIPFSTTGGSLLDSGNLTYSNSGNLLTLVNASTTNLTAGYASTTILNVSSGGILSGTFTNNGATLTLPAFIFGGAMTGNNQTLLGLGSLSAYASSTIGGGTQATGLTISGGATTTGFLNVQGTAATSTFTGDVSVRNLAIGGSATTTAANGFSLAAGCFANAGGCLSLGNISGTLATNQGGTGTTTWQTGSIPFFNGSRFTEDNANLAWDSANHRLGIGTTSPATTLSVGGNGYLTGGLGVGVLNTTAGTLQTSGNITGGGVLALNGTTGTTTLASGQGFTIGGSQFVLQQGSGNVGIGTADPSLNGGVTSALTVIQSGGNSALAVATSTSGKSFALNPNTAGGWTLYDGGANGASWSAGLSQLAGKVGVGTTSPDSTFSVTGNGHITGVLGVGTNVGSGLALDVAGGHARIKGGYGLYLYDSGNANNFLQQYDSNGYGISYNGSTNRLVINTSGNLGIGTTTPTSLLTVGNSVYNSFAQTNVALLGNSNAQTLGLVGDSAAANINFYTNASTTRTAAIKGSTTGTGSGGYLALFTSDYAANTVERLRIDSSGNLGVGTSTPRSTLHVATGGSGVLPTTNTIATFENSTHGYLSLLVPSASEEGIFFGNAANSQAGGIVYNNSNTSNGLQFRTNGNNVRAVVDSSGNLGLGTTSPATTLSVSGNGYLTGGLGVGVLTTTAGQIAVAGAGSGLQFYDRATNVLTAQWYSPSSGELDLYDQVNNENRLQTTRSTLTVLGDGATNPTFALTANQSTGFGTFVNLTPRVGFGAGNLYTTNASVLSLGTNNIEGLRIDTAQKIGVGTTTPWGQLSASSTSAYPTLAIEQHSTGPAAIFSGGSVGIGTTSPSQPLSVSGQSYFASNIAIGGTGAYEQAVNINEPGNTKTALLLNQSGITAWRIGMPANSGSLVFDPTSSNLTSPSLAITSTGNVGIASTTPWRTLSVNGTVGLSGLTSVAANQTAYLCLSSTNEVVQDSTTCLASSARFKQDIQPLSASSSLAEVMALDPVSFQYTPQYNGALEGNPNFNGTFVGFIAEDVARIDPRLITVDATGTTPNAPHGVRYENLTAILAGAVQAQQSELDALTGSSTAASTTTSSFATDFASQFFGNLFAKITAWLGSAGNGIADLFAKNVYADTLKSRLDTTQQLCIADGPNDPSPVCITKPQLAALLGAATPAASPESVTSSGSSIVQNPSPPGASATSAPNTPPVIAITGNNPATIAVGATYNDLGATITGPAADLNLGIHVIVDGGATTTPDQITIDTTTPGTHTILYIATDQAGGEGTATRTLIVAAPTTAPSSDSAASPSSAAAATNTTTGGTTTPSSASSGQGSAASTTPATSTTP